MATFTSVDDLQGAEFVDTNLHGARFCRADLSGVVMRAVHVQGADIDAPFLFRRETSFRVNGVDVIPLVEAELNRRFPGRASRRATDLDGLRRAWAALERTWAATLERVAAMPAGTADVSVDGEWSFAQTLRHLVMASPGGPRRHGARLPRHRHARRPGRDPQEPVGTRTPRDRLVVPARDPGRGVGAPPLRRPRSRRD
jgi:hypothetical protein